MTFPRVAPDSKSRAIFGRKDAPICGENKYAIMRNPVFRVGDDATMSVPPCVGTLKSGFALVNELKIPRACSPLPTVDDAFVKNTPPVATFEGPVTVIPPCDATVAAVNE
jgi:hypothetical protein